MQPTPSTSVVTLTEAVSTESKSEDEHDKDARLKEQESALVKLAELYRDQKCVSTTRKSLVVV